MSKGKKMIILISILLTFTVTIVCVISNSIIFTKEYKNICSNYECDEDGCNYKGEIEPFPKDAKEYEISGNYENNDQTKQFLMNYIKENLNPLFEEKDYQIDIGKGYIHFAYKPYGIETKNVYTVLFENDRIKINEFTKEGFNDLKKELKNVKLLKKRDQKKLKRSILSAFLKILKV